MSVFEIILLLVLWVGSLIRMGIYARRLGRTDIASGEWCGWKRSTGLVYENGDLEMKWHFEEA